MEGGENVNLRKQTHFVLENQGIFFSASLRAVLPRRSGQVARRDFRDGFDAKS